MKSIKEIIKSKEQKCFLFCPNHNFYNEVGIKQRRWGQIYREETDLTVPEAIAIAEWFEVPVTELFKKP